MNHTHNFGEASSYLPPALLIATGLLLLATPRTVTRIAARVAQRVDTRVCAFANDTDQGADA